MEGNKPKRLLDSERRFRHLVQAVIDYAIFQLDKNGTIVTWNPGGTHQGLHG
jgi:PAS domain-containing protein